MLKNKKIVVTGGCGLLGQEFIKAIIKNNGSAIIADIDKTKGEELLQSLIAEFNCANKISFCELDITSTASIQNLLNKYIDIDALVNNAYPRNKNYGKVLEEVSLSDFSENLTMHLGGYFLCMQQFSAYFKNKNGGNIINMSSIYGVIPPRFDIYQNSSFTMPVEYAAIKSSVVHLTKYFSKYYKDSNIRFNCISPGGILDNHSQEFQTNYKKYASNKGMLNKEDIVGSLLFLLSDLSTYVNGQNIIVDDAWSL